MKRERKIKASDIEMLEFGKRLYVRLPKGLGFLEMPITVKTIEWYGSTCRVDKKGNLVANNHQLLPKAIAEYGNILVNDIADQLVVDASIRHQMIFAVAVYMAGQEDPGGPVKIDEQYIKEARRQVDDILSRSNLKLVSLSEMMKVVDKIDVDEEEAEKNGSKENEG